MDPRELLRVATRSAEVGWPLSISTTTDRQPIPGYRAELLSVGTSGRWNWILSPKQVLRLERQLRAESQAELRAERMAELSAQGEED